MEKNIGKKSAPEKSGDKSSPAHKKLKDGKSAAQKKKKEHQRGPQFRQDQPRQGPSQEQESWHGFPQIGQGEPQHGPSLPQGAWSRGPPSRQDEPQQGPSQQQGAWSRGPPSRQDEPQQEPSQQQGAWSRGPPSRQDEPQQGPSLQQGAWSRGPPSRHDQPQQRPSQQEGAWSRGPPSRQDEPQQGPSQQQGAWSRGPPSRQDEPQQGPSQQQGAWSRGPPPRQDEPQQRPSQQQGAWSRGPPSRQDEPQQRPSQQQGAWSRGPPSRQDQPQQVPLKQQGTSSKGPSTQPQGQSAKSKLQVETYSGKKFQEEKDEFESELKFAKKIKAPKKSGRNIDVFSNFFPLIISNPNILVFHYDVVFEPDKPKYLLRTVWNKFASVMFPNRYTAFDGKNVYSKGPLTNEGSCSACVTITDLENNREKEFKVKIVKVREISFSCFDGIQRRIKDDISMNVLPEAELSVLEIIMRNWACDNFVKSARSFFPKAATNPLSVDLSQKLCMRIGYFQSAFLGSQPYLNFDISHKAFYKEGPILNILDCFRHRHTKVLDVEEMTRFLRKAKVEYHLPNDPSSRRVFRINKLMDDANHQTFKKHDGTELTVARYFETEKNCRLKYPGLPLLWVGPTQKTIYVPMEFCTIAPDQIYLGVLDPFETRKMVENATSNARDRRRDVEEIFFKADINNHCLMKEFGLRVSDRMERVPARVLEPPRLKTSRPIKVDNGVWRIQDFLEPVTLNKWCILVLDKYVQKQNVINLQGMIKSKGKEYNMQIAEPAKAPIDGDPSFIGLKKAFSQLKGMEMVFVIISEVKGVYSRVKAICETQEGILTQCIKSKTVSQDPRKLTTTVQNILLKVNAKLGGKNHCLHQSSIPKCLDGYVMVVGADVTHPSPGMTIPSVAAITVSCDPAAFQYGTTTRVQPKGEMIVDLEEIMVIHLKKFYEIRKNYPEKIIFFRDGVSEGELKKVFMGELMALRKACGNFCQPKITFVIVQKRHHTRLYPTSSRDEEGKNFNVPVGTCVDSDIVHPRDLDFYLVSHASILGTARPTRYRLLYDDNKLTDDELETLSYYLCHLFSRCNRSVSYPSPTFNAHLAAARVRAYLEGLNLMSCHDLKSIQREMSDKISGISPMFFV